ncbi:MAG: hypothetical protein HOE90_17705 [Bacteriovoracaceae bacterium]|jgi:hypothetical protein|nr:hypothetical protein [Bacteriovoracaceae bacterium]
MLPSILLLTQVACVDEHIAKDIRLYVNFVDSNTHQSCIVDKGVFEFKHYENNKKIYPEGTVQVDLSNFLYTDSEEYTTMTTYQTTEYDYDGTNSTESFNCYFIPKYNDLYQEVDTQIKSNYCEHMFLEDGTKVLQAQFSLDNCAN